MTEDEAKNRWCPAARVISPITMPEGQMVWVVGNRVSMPEHIGTVSSGEPSNPPPSRCIGGDCMAWRWVPTGARLSRPFRDGYCGLAGEVRS